MIEFESYAVSKYDEILSYQCYLEEEMRYIAITEALYQVNHGSQFAFYNLNMIQNELILISSLKIEEFNNKVFYLSKAKDQPMLPQEYNLVWHALSKEANGLSRQDKEFLLSLSGTIIAKSGKNGGVSFTHKGSLAINEKVLDTIVFGGNGSDQLKLYRCDNPDLCLNPVVQSQGFKKEDTMLYKISEIIASLE